MSHTTIYFLTGAEDYDHAVSRVSEYLETESFFDNFNILSESSGLLEEKRKELKEFINGWEWKEAAEDFLNQAEKHKAEGHLSTYGYKLIKAGELFAQYLTIDTHIYNIESEDYSVPEIDNDLWAIAVDFHY